MWFLEYGAAHFVGRVRAMGCDVAIMNISEPGAGNLVHIVQSPATHQLNHRAASITDVSGCQMVAPDCLVQDKLQ
jgi:hypothetical protein